jgi:hypothetical protein
MAGFDSREVGAQEARNLDTRHGVYQKFISTSRARVRIQRSCYCFLREVCVSIRTVADVKRCN